MQSFAMISVDFQKDFTSPQGACYVPGPSVDFLKGTLLPFLERQGVEISEIVSDYRQPRPGDPRDCCRPGEEGYESEIPDSRKRRPVWLKCMNSPVWVRENIGEPGKEPGIPYPDADGFSDWLERGIGKPGMIVLIGLTLDRCVLCTAQELSFRGYEVRILKEATDTASGSPEKKEHLLANPPLTYWAEGITWEELRDIMR